jgi:nitrate reductase assembly molybdenum cofactor insertion protein NarJ
MREKPDFLPVVTLEELTRVPIKTLYNSHSKGSGPLSEILTKLGGRLGAWRCDYEAYVASRRRLKDAA